MPPPGRVVVAFDKFKGTLGAAEACRAFAQALRPLLPRAEVVELPMADGGEGTLDALVSALGGQVRRVRVRGPLLEPVEARLARLGDGRAGCEAADACGLWRLGGALRPLQVSSEGVGDLLLAAGAGARVVAGLGGVASTDGGTGMARALGYRFLDRRGRSLPPGGGALARLARIVPPPRPPRAAVTALADVDNPLTGRHGAARVFAPQKGASPSEVELLERGLEVLAARLEADLGAAVAGLPGAGAAGGLGAGLVAFCGAVIEPGAPAIARAAGLERLLEGAVLVVSGEGALDRSSLGGKAPIVIARLARAKGVPCVLVAGRAEHPVGVTEGARVVDLTELCGPAAHADPAGALARAAVLVAERLAGPP